MNDNNISVKAHHYSCELENLLKKISPNDFPTQGEIRINLYNKIENVCFRLCSNHQKEEENIMAFLNKYSFIGQKIDTLIETIGSKNVEDFINEFKHLLKGCGYDV